MPGLEPHVICQLLLPVYTGLSILKNIRELSCKRYFNEQKNQIIYQINNPDVTMPRLHAAGVGGGALAAAGRLSPSGGGRRGGVRTAVPAAGAGLGGPPGGAGRARTAGRRHSGRVHGRGGLARLL